MLARIARWCRYRYYYSHSIRTRHRAGYEVSADHETRYRVLARRAAGY